MTADYAYLVGFKDGVFPTEGGLRYWLTARGSHSQNGDTATVEVDNDRLTEIALEYLNDLIAQSVVLLLTDIWSNLTTLVRLFREATAATGV